MDIERVGSLSERENRASILLIPCETFPLLVTHIESGLFEINEATALQSSLESGQARE
jgi:hypothetical protein